VILFTLMMEAIRSSGTPILARATRRQIPEDDIFWGRKSELVRRVGRGVEGRGGRQFQKLTAAGRMNEALLA
jgi:hypothetical protein